MRVQPEKDHPSRYTKRKSSQEPLEGNDLASAFPVAKSCHECTFHHVSAGDALHKLIHLARSTEPIVAQVVPLSESAFGKDGLKDAIGGERVRAQSKVGDEDECKSVQEELGGFVDDVGL